MDNPSNPLPTLPMHLMLTLASSLSSPFAWQCASAGLLPWNPDAGKRPPNPAEQEKLKKAVHEEAGKRAENLLEGILRYYDSPYERHVKEPPAVWRRGNARLLDYGAPSPSGRGAASAGVRTLTPTLSQRERELSSLVLFIPSLINRYYILDLSYERSMVRYLAAQGIHPLILDWGAPGEHEMPFDCGDYITDILIPAIDFLHKTSGRKIILAGYCMGGVLALAAAQLAKQNIAGIALLATPWDFHCERFAPFVVNKQWQPVLDGWLKSKDTLPADLIQSLFYWTDPWLFEHKFARFAGLPAKSDAEQEFVALEHWVNDGVPMTAGVARESLIGWAQKNIVACGEWKVAGKKIDPRSLKLPTFIAMPQNDHVVPIDCALPLAKAMPHAKITTPSSGHVGMIVGSRAKKELWGPFAGWVLDITN